MLEHTPLNNLAERFERFARLECRTSSPLYEQLSLEIAHDPTLLEIISYARTGQPAPNLFFGAVHYLLARDKAQPLAAFYPSLCAAPSPVEKAYSHFRAFCLGHQTAIIALISRRLVQTNEVRRCVCLLPAFGLVGAAGSSLALIEIGCSAGLNLHWNAYGYDYSENKKYGNPTSPVQLSCELRGKLRPPLPEKLPQVSFRVGLDLNPLEVNNPDDTDWLRALIWPEHHVRAALLQNALTVAQNLPVELRAGDALDLLPGIIERVPADAQLCLFHSFTLNQFSPPMRERFDNLLTETSTHRPVAVISIEWRQGNASPALELTRYEQMIKTQQLLGWCDGHANWLEWLAA